MEIIFKEGQKIISWNGVASRDVDVAPFEGSFTRINGLRRNPVEGLADPSGSLGYSSTWRRAIVIALAAAFLCLTL